MNSDSLLRLKTGHLTYAEYRTWPTNERWELIRGNAWAMSPAPAWVHQELSVIIASELRSFLKGKPCRPFAAPVDVFLPESGEDPNDLDTISTIVQPDLGVVCDHAKIIPRGIMGAPDVIMEIISPSSVLRDLNLKKELYAQHGCREYWVWDTRLAWVSRFNLNSAGTWDEGLSFDADAIVESLVLPGFSLSMPELRAEMGIKD